MVTTIAGSSGGSSVMVPKFLFEAFYLPLLVVCEVLPFGIDIIHMSIFSKWLTSSSRPTRCAQVLFSNKIIFMILF